MLAHLSASPIVHSISCTIANCAMAQGQTQIQRKDASPVGTAQNEPAVPDRAAARLAPAEDKIQPTDPPTSTQCTHASAASTSSCRAQCVLSKRKKYKIARWMVVQEEVYVNKIPSKAVLEFPRLFHGTANENIVRALSYWRTRQRWLVTIGRKGR